MKFGDENPKYLIALLHLEFASVACIKLPKRVSLKEFGWFVPNLRLIGRHSGQMTNCLAKGVILFNLRLHLALY